MESIKEFRNGDFTSYEIDTSELTEFIKKGKQTKEFYDDLLEIRGHQSILNEMKDFIKEKIDLYNKFCDGLKDEILWHYENQNFNIAYAFACSYRKTGSKGSKQLYNKVKNKYLEQEISKSEKNRK